MVPFSGHSIALSIPVSVNNNCKNPPTVFIRLYMDIFYFKYFKK
jgi:hypothetical protein